MSHNIVLKDVKFTDLNELSRVIDQLTEGQCILIKDATKFRTFPGQSDRCDAAIRMPGDYDIGLQKRDGGYVPVADFSMMMRSNLLAGGGHPMGKVQQEYALREAEYTAAQNGMSATRLPQKDGTVTLELVKAT